MKRLYSLSLAMLFVSALLITSTPISQANAECIHFWGPVDVPSDGTSVTTPAALEAGKVYKIVATEIFWYDESNNLAADAMYYTTDDSNAWAWGNHFPAPGGHSFLQINGDNVDWGPFSNGNTGHTYTIYYLGEGIPITFQIVDWIDGDYTNNECHLPVEIYDCGVGVGTPGYWKNHPEAWPELPPRPDVCSGEEKIEIGGVCYTGTRPSRS